MKQRWEYIPKDPVLGQTTWNFESAWGQTKVLLLCTLERAQKSELNRWTNVDNQVAALRGFVYVFLLFHRQIVWQSEKQVTFHRSFYSGNLLGSIYNGTQIFEVRLLLFSWSTHWSDCLLSRASSIRRFSAVLFTKFDKSFENQPRPFLYTPNIYLCRAVPISQKATLKHIR